LIKNNKGEAHMKIALWVIQIFLATVFLWHGWLFISPPKELMGIMNAQFAVWFRVFLGIMEIMASVGLILPSLTRIKPWLTPLAAAGLMIVTISASIFHISRGEIFTVMITMGLFILASFVAYMRWKVQTVFPKHMF
jgi:putative oxidoreductase